ncbi:DUF262 domain-containing protein [Halorhodospira sp. 9622]|uniref:DUF262 domain-containing protein n=1 Tax=Halorhodospira sp. 9622 TaxID=2899136 RepID=UPI001EE7C691|nr:DUF262 domain-containing protein [Halorhodospira sp. 9622]MCG5537846.1 DUF262 domain-containing protein [Halorhodospira sp. 9622]
MSYSEQNIAKEQELTVFEGAESEEEEPFVSYDIATYPSDLTLSVIFEMWKNEDLEIPRFQRHFVWSIKQSSLLIESFLMGLPVPQAFIYVDEANKNLVIDGQQRILSVIYYFEGYFGSENLQGRRQVFRLTGLNEKSPYARKRFVDLDESDQRKLKGCVLRFMNVRQLDPKKEHTSIYHIFERLNTGGTPLKPQEIRNCVFRGKLVQVLGELNNLPQWRRILGKRGLDKHQKDVELILRVLALYKKWGEYEKPMKEFLNSEMRKNKNAQGNRIHKFKELFPAVCEKVVEELGDKPFHIRGPLNSSVLDSVLCVLIESGAKFPKDFAERYKKLVADSSFEETTYYGTSDEKVLKQRFEIAKKHLVG